MRAAWASIPGLGFRVTPDSSIPHPSTHAQVAVRAERNEVLDQQSLIVRYQQQMAALRAHLRRVSSATTDAAGGHNPMHPEV